MFFNEFADPKFPIRQLQQSGAAPLSKQSKRSIIFTSHSRKNHYICYLH